MWLQDPKGFRCGGADPEIVKQTLMESNCALAERNHQYFSAKLSDKDVWRAYPYFKDLCAYVDIETDNGQSAESVTVVGLYDGKSYKGYVKGKNLADFKDSISHFSMIVTFFGTGFDMPVLIKKYGPIFDQIHFDVCPVLHRLGFQGGLKKLEKEFGLSRTSETSELNGRDAIRLWHRYEYFKEKKALDTLLTYNKEDVVSLPVLAQQAYEHSEKALLNPPDEA